MYKDGEYDLAGFCVGAVEKSKIIDGSQVAAGDKIIGLRSSGPHSNGYSLIRKIIDTHAVPLDTKIGEQTLGEAVLAPTRIYVRALLQLMAEQPVNAVAHITGGGIPGNLNRVLPENCHAVVDEAAWDWPAIFKWLMATGNVERSEMYRTFNCGVGMMVVVKPELAAQTIELLNAAGEQAFELGEIRAGEAEQVVQIVNSAA